MTPIVSVLLTVVAIQTIAIIVLLIDRVRLARVQLTLRESESDFASWRMAHP